MFRGNLISALILWVVIYLGCGSEIVDVRDSTPKKETKDEMHKFFIQ
jgi:hypothetical protein